MKGVRAAVVALGSLAAPALAQDRPVIVADSYPMAYFAEALAGDAAEVRLLVPEGRDPASWRPTLGEIADIQAADLIVLNGAGLADWTTRAALPRARTVETGRGLSDAFIATQTITHSHGAEGSHSHEGVASHLWLDLDLAARQAEALAPALARAVPGADVEASLASLTEELRALDALGDALTQAPVAVVTSHPRYDYLARAYDLDAHSLDWEAGAAPDPDALSDLARLAAETGARTLIWEADPGPQARDAVTSLGLTQAVLPPLSMPVEGADFATTMRNGLTDLAEALRAAEG
ncbi:MAG: metal ABC transporter substrate-binding protein [Paracoccaceae bacterium]